MKGDTFPATHHGLERGPTRGLWGGLQRAHKETSMEENTNTNHLDNFNYTKATKLCMRWKGSANGREDVCRLVRQRLQGSGRMPFDDWTTSHRSKFNKC
jgi:Zn-dependent alcohol dehydrogenase